MNDDDLPSSRSTRRVRVLGGVAGLAVFAASSLLAVELRSPAPPREWDARLLPLVEFVERERGYEFKHPVPVEFLTGEAYSKAIGNDGKQTEAQRELYQKELRFWRSLGAIEGDLDLGGEHARSVDTQSGGFYDVRRQRIVLKDSDSLSALVKRSLVHELTHALQFQHFEDDIRSARSADQSFALSALIEGDANRMEEAYWRSLTREAQDDALRAATDDSRTEDEESSVPSLLQVLFSAKYQVGAAFQHFMKQSNAGFDLSFRRMPRSSEQVLDPIAYLLDDRPKAVNAPSIPKGATRIGKRAQSFGAFSWFVTLAPHVGGTDAWKAVAGWGGDSITLYRLDDRQCARMDFVGDTAIDTDEMHAALESLAKRVDASDPIVERNGSTVRLEVCDPGPKASAASYEPGWLLLVPIFGVTTAAKLYSDLLEPERLRCAVDAILDEFSEVSMRLYWQGDEDASYRFDDLRARALARC